MKEMAKKMQQPQVPRLDPEREATAKLVRPLPLHVAPSLQFVSELRARLLQLGDGQESLRAA